MIGKRSDERGAEILLKRFGERSTKRREDVGGRFGINRTTLLRTGSDYGTAVVLGIGVLLLLINVLLSFRLLRRATEVASATPVPGAGVEAAPPGDEMLLAPPPPRAAPPEEEVLLPPPPPIEEDAPRREEPRPGEERPERRGVAQPPPGEERPGEW
jgi:hypothetical protein